MSGTRTSVSGPSQQQDGWQRLRPPLPLVGCKQHAVCFDALWFTSFYGKFYNTVSTARDMHTVKSGVHSSDRGLLGPYAIHGPNER